LLAITNAEYSANNNDVCGQLLATALWSSLETPTEFLHFMNSSLGFLKSHTSIHEDIAKGLKSGPTSSTWMYRLSENFPTSVVDVTGNQSYTLDTGKKTAYFSHKIRGSLVTQLIVTIKSPEMLLSLIKQCGLYLQTERSYWNTFARVILYFNEGYDENDKYGRENMENRIYIYILLQLQEHNGQN
jgi:hypothetical protein